MEAGDFRHRVALQSPQETQDPQTGEMVISWQTQATVWASIRPLRAREFIAAQATQSQVTTEIFIRYRAVDPTWRAVHMVNGVPGTVYNIHGVMADPHSGREHVKLAVSSGLNEGQ